MTQTITLVLVIIIIIYLVAKEFNKKSYVETIYKNASDKILTSQTGVEQCFSKEVIEIYLDVIANPNEWILDYCRLVNKKKNIFIWAANSVDDRFFCNSTGGTSGFHEKNIELTKYDKVLLDKIVKAYKNRQSILVTKFFI